MGSIYSKTSKVEEDWEAFEKDNIVSKKGSFGFFMDIHPDGILVEEIIKNTPASNSELKAGDIILSINGKTFKNLKDKFQIDVNVKPNLPAEFIVKSKGRTKKIIIVITIRMKTSRKGLGTMLIIELMIFCLAITFN